MVICHYYIIVITNVTLFWYYCHQSKHAALCTDEDSKGDMEELQLGNVGIAEAGRQVLSHCMLQGLQTGIQQRLSKYATADLEEDLAALAEAKAASLG